MCMSVCVYECVCVCVCEYVCVCECVCVCKYDYPSIIIIASYPRATSAIRSIAHNISTDHNTERRLRGDM